ncbi:hypothetical protein [Ochrobactrum soli]|uniref:Uncharacterized protein n=1 Tax=Ochrobactrum soli TaxID=2448455 RepID=A0A849KLZ8_9HYPH|nr:hypothetical protein [[Ochrobactrum] soli]NNU62875.1 hypothetical protein [[Ochrobactrum] soli]
MSFNADIVSNPNAKTRVIMVKPKWQYSGLIIFLFSFAPIASAIFRQWTSAKRCSLEQKRLSGFARTFRFSSACNP